MSILNSFDGVVGGLKPLVIRGKELLPIIEGGKGIAASSGQSAGAFAETGAIGTFSGVNATSYDEHGNRVPYVYNGKTRLEKHEELIAQGIRGGIQQAKIAHDMSNGNGNININILWEMGGAERILEGILDGAKGLVHGVTCGAGMPYKLSDIAAKYDILYYPIVSSMRAFRALWKRAYSKTSDLLGAVVYEDPWLAGGHNGLSNSEDPKKPQSPFERVAELRKFMNSVGLEKTPIIMAGGVWHLRDWQEWFDNEEIGPIGFQFGSRPLLSKESQIPDTWKKKLLTLKSGDVYLNRFSPTGFYSSAVENNFIKDLIQRNDSEIEYRKEPEGYFTEEYAMPPRGRKVYVSPEDLGRINQFIREGYTTPLRTPDDSIIFATEEKSKEIVKDQVDCMGCLSHCRFSNWKDHDDYTTGKKADPRSFCIQKTLMDIVHTGDVENNLMFAGHNAYKFATDPFYANGNIPTIRELVSEILKGN